VDFEEETTSPSPSSSSSYSYACTAHAGAWERRVQKKRLEGRRPHLACLPACRMSVRSPALTLPSDDLGKNDNTKNTSYMCECFD
jgi:hypothetical protein